MYPASIADLIYEEILEDRRLFRHDLCFHQRKYYITLNQTLYMKMLKIYEITEEISFLKQEQLVFSLQQCMKHYKVDIKNELFLFLCGNESFLIKLFILKYKTKDVRILRYFLHMYQKEEWAPFFNAFICDPFEYEEDLDLTYVLRSFLDELYLFIIQHKKQVIKITKTAFMNMYPCLNEFEKQFYLHHHRKEEYYSIHDFQEFSNRSYEASRLSMEKLCRENLYRRVKIGKKHMYIPNDVLQD